MTLIKLCNIGNEKGFFYVDVSRIINWTKIDQFSLDLKENLKKKLFKRWVELVKSYSCVTQEKLKLNLKFIY